MKRGEGPTARRVVRWFQDNGGRGTASECAAAIGVESKLARATILELAESGLFKRTGEKRKGAGRPENVWAYHGPDHPLEYKP